MLAFLSQDARGVKDVKRVVDPPADILLPLLQDLDRLLGSAAPLLGRLLAHVLVAVVCLFEASEVVSVLLVLSKLPYQFVGNVLVSGLTLALDELANLDAQNLETPFLAMHRGLIFVLFFLIVFFFVLIRDVEAAASTRVGVQAAALGDLVGRREGCLPFLAHESSREIGALRRDCVCGRGLTEERDSRRLDFLGPLETLVFVRRHAREEVPLDRRARLVLCARVLLLIRSNERFYRCGLSREH